MMVQSWYNDGIIDILQPQSFMCNDGMMMLAWIAIRSGSMSAETLQSMLKVLRNGVVAWVGFPL